jgi:hypothetical protein
MFLDQEPRMTENAQVEHQNAFLEKFDDEERQMLLAEDREAQLGVSAILATLIAIGMLLGLFSVSLIAKFGLR